jgi:hypothetical protein
MEYLHSFPAINGMQRGERLAYGQTLVSCWQNERPASPHRQTTRHHQFAFSTTKTEKLLTNYYIIYYYINDYEKG